SRHEAGRRLSGKGWPVSGSALARPPLKSPASCAAVGTIAVRVPVVCQMRRYSFERKKNTLSRLMGPPTVPPKLLYRFLGLAAAKKLRASKWSLRKNSKSVPCTALVPERVITFTWAPELRPYSDE